MGLWLKMRCILLGCSFFRRIFYFFCFHYSLMLWLSFTIYSCTLFIRCSYMVVMVHLLLGIPLTLIQIENWFGLVMAHRTMAQIYNLPHALKPYLFIFLDPFTLWIGFGFGPPSHLILSFFLYLSLGTPPLCWRIHPRDRGRATVVIVSNILP